MSSLCLLRYILFSLLNSISLSANNLNDDSTEIGFNPFVFILILAIIFVSYKTIIFYIKQEKKNAKQKKKQTPVHGIVNPSDILLDEGKDLIDFLKINLQTNNINNDTFRVQNLLNEVYGLVEPSLQKNNVEFIYDIDSSIPIELVGNSLQIEQALYNLLSNIIDISENTTVTVSFKKNDQNNEITIGVQNNENRLFKDSHTLDSTHILLEKINATLSFQDGIYSISLPFLKSQLYHESYYSLPKTVIGKKVLLIEDNIYTAEIIKKSFQYFGLIVTIEKTNRFIQEQNFNDYDILIVDVKKLTPILLRYIEEIKNKKSLYVISLERHYGEKDRRFKPNPLIQKYLYKPLSMGMIFGFLYEIYVIHENKDSLELKHSTQEKSTPVFIDETENITPESFQDFNHIHILVAEDNKINQKIIQSVLNKSNIKITIANNGQEALNYLNDEYSIDIVLMDINMPIMDGYQATKKIRQNHNFSDLPIIIVSGLGFRNEIDQMYIAGANAHLTKPFKIGQLYSVFKMFLNTDTTSAHKDDISGHTLDSNTLDIKKGSAFSNNILAYRDILRETLVIHKSSDEKIKEFIIKKDYLPLYTYCTNILTDSKHIGATNLTQILNEILILLNNKEEELLQQYIVLYRDEWQRTKRGIELYLKNSTAY